MAIVFRYIPGSLQLDDGGGSPGYVYLDATGFVTVRPTANPSDGDKGDITVSGSGAVWTIDAGVVTYAKIQDVSAGDRLLGRVSGAGDVEEITCTAAGRAILDDADAAAQRTTLGAAAVAHTHAWADVTGEPTTLAGYGITDGATDAELAAHEADTTAVHGIANTANLSLVGHTHTLADITDDGGLAARNTVGTAEIDNDAVTYAKIQNVTDARLLGRSAGSSGDVQEITVGTGLSLSAGSLTASASGTVVSETAFGQSSTAGAASTFSRGDHTHGTPGFVAPNYSGADPGAPSTGEMWFRTDL